MYKSGYTEWVYMCWGAWINILLIALYSLSHGSDCMCHPDESLDEKTIYSWPVTGSKSRVRARIYMKPRPTKRGGREQEILLGAPKLLRGPMRLFFNFMSCIFILLLYLSLSQHCLHSMSKCLDRIISNAFMVSVDKLFDSCKHVEAPPLINWPCYMNN